MTIDYLNTNALLPRTVTLAVALVLAIGMASFLRLISAPSFLVVAAPVGLGVVLCNTPRISAKSTVWLMLGLLWIGRTIKSLWFAFVGDPFRPFAYALVMSLASLLLTPYVVTLLTPVGGAITPHVLSAENTRAITILGTFIPFVFAAATFAQNRVAQRVPEAIARTALAGASISVWGFLTVVFLLGLAVPFLSWTTNAISVLQTVMIGASFLTVILFVLCVLRVSDTRHLLPYFRNVSERRLRRFFARGMPFPHIPGARMQHFIETHILGLFGRSMELLLGPLTVPNYCSDEAIRVVESLMGMAKRGVSNDSVPEAAFALEQVSLYASTYFGLRQSHVDANDAFNLYLATEMRKLVESCATKEKEKFLDAMCQTVRVIALSACQYKGIGANADGNGLITPWEKIIEKTVLATSPLENTAYPNDAIGALGDLGVECLRRGHLNTVEFGLFDCFRLLGKTFAESKWPWHAVMVSRSLGSLNQIFLAYAKELPRQGFLRDHFLGESWPDTVREILKAKLENYTPKAFWQPLASITCPMGQPHQLLTCYRDALQLVGPQGLTQAQNLLREWRHPCSPEDAKKMLTTMREQLASAHEPFLVLVNSRSVLADLMVWSDLASAIACLFWMDLCAASDGVSVTDEWTNTVVRHFQATFSRFAQNNIALRKESEREPFWLDDMGTLLAVPALGLTFRVNSNAVLVDRVTESFCEMLISLFSGLDLVENGRRSSGRIGRHLLLVSAWLATSESKLPVRQKLETVLKAHPVVMRKSWLTGHSKLQAYPSGPMHHDAWYLFPSCFWSNGVQDMVKDRLMQLPALETYAEDFVVWSDDEDEWPGPGLPGGLHGANDDPP